MKRKPQSPNERAFQQAALELLDKEGPMLVGRKLEEFDNIYDALRCPRLLMLFTQEDAGPLHCQAASAALAEQRLFD